MYAARVVELLPDEGRQEVDGPRAVKHGSHWAPWGGIYQHFVLRLNDEFTKRKVKSKHRKYLGAKFLIVEISLWSVEY